jgi:kynurenine formamidase
MRLVDLTTTLRTRPPRALVEPDRIVAWQHATATHVDAPWHYGPKSEGKPARTVDELPLDWFFQDAVVLDFSARHDGGSISPQDVEAALKGYVLKSLDIVLLRSGTDGSSDPDRYKKMPELSPEAVAWLHDRGVRVIGTDSVSPDRGNFDEFKAGKRERFYVAHHFGRKREYCIVELLTNLDQLPHHGFRVSLFPIKVDRGSGGWCRAVAMVP